MAEENDVGKVVWMDLTVPNAEEVKNFYSEVVGWKADDHPMDDYDDYNILRPGDGECVAAISRRLKMSEKTVRKYRDEDQLPSQIERPERTYRTRQDPLAEFWSEIEAPERVNNLETTPFCN